VFQHVDTFRESLVITQRPASKRFARGPTAGTYPRWPEYASAALAALLILDLSYAAWSTRHRHFEASPPDAARAIAGLPALLDVIVRQHIFGDAGAQRSQESSTTSVLKLHGTIAFPDAKSGYGIISASDIDRLYPVGAAVPDGGILHEVYADRVTIEREGALIVLELPHRAGATAAVTLASDTPADDQDNGTKSAIGAPLPDNSRDHPLDAPRSSAARALRLIPAIENGRLLGYRVVALDHGRSPLGGLGQFATVSAIDGTPLTDGAVAATMFERLARAGGDATVTVNVGDESRDVRVDVSGLAAFIAQRSHH
jgi:general secretion pathway protein C